jgi:hypothetical protein
LDEVEWNEMGALTSLGSTMEFLPTDMIPQIIDTFIKVLRDSALQPDNIQLLKRVFIFPTIATLKPGKGSLRAKLRKTLMDIYKGNWDDQTAGEYDGRMRDIKEKPKKARPIKIFTKSPEEIATEMVNKRVLKLVDAGAGGKGFKLLMNDKPRIQPTLAVVEDLRTRQYTRNPKLDIDKMNIQIPQSGYDITADDITNIVNGMQNCVASGYDNFNVDHLKQLLRYKSGVQGEVTRSDILKEELAQFMNRTLVHSQVPKEVSGYSSGGEQIALGKEDGSVRPICMIMIYTKIVTKVLFKHNKDGLKEIFGTEQVGCGTSNGTDKMNHSVILARELNPSHDFIKSDGDDAFQRIDIDNALEVIAENIPGLMEFIEPLLDTQKNHVFVGCKEGVQTITSTQGAGQGLPYASHVYGITKVQITKASKEKLVSGGVSIDMADDNGSVGVSEELMDMTEYVATEGAKVGLIMKKKKYKVLMGIKESLDDALRIQNQWCTRFDISPDVVHIHPANLQDPSRDKEYGCELVGIPMGSDAYVQDSLDEKMDAMSEDFLKIPKLGNAQAEYAFLRDNMTNKINYLARGLKPSTCDHLIREFDRSKRLCLAQILRAQKNVISDNSWELAQLTYGGGLQRTPDSDAFVASMIQSLKFIGSVVPIVNDIVKDVMKIFEETEVESLAHILEDTNCPGHLRELFITVKHIQIRDPSISIRNMIEAPEDSLKKSCFG